MERHKICFKPKDRYITVDAGTTLLFAAVENNVKIRYTCGGNATCGTCRVLIEEGLDNLSPVVKREIELLGEDRLQKGYRLACQSKVRGSVTARIPNWFVIPEKLSESSSPPEPEIQTESPN